MEPVEQVLATKPVKLPQLALRVLLPISEGLRKGTLRGLWSVLDVGGGLLGALARGRGPVGGPRSIRRGSRGTSRASLAGAPRMEGVPRRWSSPPEARICRPTCYRGGGGARGDLIGGSAARRQSHLRLPGTAPFELVWDSSNETTGRPKKRPQRRARLARQAQTRACEVSSMVWRAQCVRSDV